MIITKNMGVTIHIRKLGGATYQSIICQNPKNKSAFKCLDNSTAFGDFPQKYKDVAQR